MRMPAIQGVIDRRVLVNFHVDAEVMSRWLPAPFEPLTVAGRAIAGVCLIRLVKVRPRGWPAWLGIRSENAAHRVAVQWQHDGKIRHGVFIPRRDTDSKLNSYLGGRLFPGEHHHARFTVLEHEHALEVAMQSDDGSAHIRVNGRVADRLPKASVFGSLQASSDFFAAGSLGYSVTRRPGTYDGLELACDDWRVTPLDVTDVVSSFFADRRVFPEGSVSFDHALLMRGIVHAWHGRPSLCCSATADAA